MPDDKKPAAGDPDFDAALSAWETGAGNTPDPAPHPALARVKAQFAAHPAVCDLTRVLDAAQNDVGDPVPVTVRLQPGLLALLMHIEGLDAEQAKRAPLSQERVLSGLISNHLENLLHTLVTDPTHHPHFAKTWNVLCAQAGAAALSVPDGMPSAGPESDEESVF
ncbi:MAG: hypothetical protein CVT80_00705 [Alphaproteobacteria bacterium HGW-Alphaproteobacteria-2]|nr:MAG: hypothetical protein CVT80_00705 [Alphaproteobacteria bacterium HGW-Alphaproteobacteria-2]